MASRGVSILLAGPMAVGKSSASRGLEEVGYEAVSFGRLVQAHAASQGFDPADRSTLQRVGTELHRSFGAEGMVNELLASARSDGPLVVDGVRHLDVLAALRAALDSRFVYLAAGEAALKARWIARGNDELAWKSARAHEVESQQDALKDAADFVVDTTQVDAAAAVDSILNAISHRGG